MRTPHARLEAQRAKLAAGEPIRCECYLDLIDTPEAAAEKHGTVVHAGDCERQWGSGYQADYDLGEPE